MYFIQSIGMLFVCIVVKSKTATDIDDLISNATLTLAICRIHQMWRIMSRLHHRVLWGHAGVLGRHWITCMWILRGSQWLSISVIHGLHGVAGHGDLLGCGSESTDGREGKNHCVCQAQGRTCKEQGSHHRRESCPSAAFSGRGNSRST